MPTYLQLAYDGNYAGRLKLTPWQEWEVFTYKGEVYLAHPTGEVIFFYE